MKEGRKEGVHLDPVFLAVAIFLRGDYHLPDHIIRKGKEGREGRKEGEEGQ
jgi:hypothetical protein